MSNSVSTQAMVAASYIYNTNSQALAECETVKGKFRVAFGEAKNYWGSTDDEVRFGGGVGAVMLDLGQEHPMYEKIERELEMLRDLSAAISGVPVDMEAAFNKLGQDDDEPIGIMGIWMEVKNQ